MLSGRQRFRTLLLVTAALLSAGLGVLAFETNAFRSLELNTVDTRFSIRGTETHDGDVVVVGIDAQAFQTLGDERWPFTHDEHAKVLNRLRRDGAKVVAFDIQFSEPSDTDAESLAFLDSISRTDNVVVASTEVDDYGNGNVFSYFAPLKIVNSTKPHALNDWLRKELGVEVGYSSFQPDTGGVFRRMSYQESGLRTFAVVTAEVATGRRIDGSDFDDGRAWIDYYGPPGSIREISYGDVWAGRTKPGTFRDKIVVVGATSPTLQDVHPSSTSGDGEMSGPEIQAHSVATAMRGFPLEESGDGLDIALIVLLGFVAPAASLVMPIFRTLALAILIGAAYTVAVQLAFNDGTILPFVYPIAALALGTVAAVAVHAVTEAFERQRTREIFGRFVPDSVVGQVLEQADGLRLGGVAREATVMFSDLRGFTSFAESLEPDQVIKILNRYLTAMVDDAILPHGGTLVDYMGDGIMAVFGAPIEMDDHADRALAAARDKLVELDKFNAWLRTEMGFEKSFQMGIGLNSGRVMSGNVGSEQRLAYTAIGDTTNTAARLEAMTKNTPYMILLADSTRAEVSTEPDDIVFVDEMEVRGRQQKVKLWSVTQSTKEDQAGATFQSVSGAPAKEAAPPA